MKLEIGRTYLVPMICGSLDNDGDYLMEVSNGASLWINQDDVEKFGVRSTETNHTPPDAPCILTYKEGRYIKTETGTYSGMLDRAKYLAHKDPVGTYTVARVLGTVSLEPVVKEVA